jgi:cell division protein FtsI (penicillin-binding protein 3)
MMVALEDGLIHPDDSVDTGNGVAIIAGQHLEDHNAKRGGYGTITAAKSIRYSSNIGVAKLILRAYGDDPGKYVDGIYRIGLNKDLHLEIPGYGVARIRHPKDTKQYWSRSTLPWMSFGYETQIPPIYTLTFFNAIANDGKMVKPIFVKEIRDDGKIIEKKKPEVINGKICSPTTLAAIRQMLDDVVNASDGTGKPAHSDEIRISGKTGTAQISKGTSGYSSGGKSHQVSFCGYFPSEKPKYSCIVVIRNPRNGPPSGGQMCGSVFKEVAEEIYARDKIFRKIALPADTIHPLVPKVKNGLWKQSQYALKQLDISYIDSLSGNWSTSSLHDNTLVMKDRIVREDLVPNVIGMGAKDAVFAMESAGLRVQLSGRGAVSAQSIGAGAKSIKGQTVSLVLK